MAKFVSATDVAIAAAHKAGTLRLVERASRFGGTTVAIEDGVGVIEVQDTMNAARKRVAACTVDPDSPTLEPRMADYVRASARRAVALALEGRFDDADRSADAVATFHPAYGRDVRAHVAGLRANRA